MQENYPPYGGQEDKKTRNMSSGRISRLSLKEPEPNAYYRQDT